MSKKLKLKFSPASDRGFMRADFTDLYANPCSIQESSLAEIEAIWLGANTNRMHLTREMARALLPALNYFVDTGYLPGRDDDA